MLFAIGVADAYGASAEYLKFPRDNAVRDALLRFDRYVQHPTHKDVAPGCYTDDTEMSVANAHVLLECAQPFTPLMFADAYVAEFKRGAGRKGYARNFQKFLESISSGAEFLAKIKPDSNKNGAAMRSVPIGVLPDCGKTLDVATMQARVTHDTADGRFSARAVALMAHLSMYSSVPLGEIPELCLALLPAEDKRYEKALVTDWKGGPVESSGKTSVGVNTVHAVCHLLAHEKSLMKMLERSIRWGGDVDSVIAIAWGIASARFADEKLPLFLDYGLEKGATTTGTPYLLDLGAKLMDKFDPKPAT
jgi:ADP-ribosylglycohydrolase